VVQLGGDREKIRTSEAIRPSECPFSTRHCLRPLLKKGGNLSRPSVSYFIHARSARLYGLTDSMRLSSFMVSAKAALPQGWEGFGEARRRRETQTGPPPPRKKKYGGGTGDFDV
jgi:hypothetical protein